MLKFTALLLFFKSLTMPKNFFFILFLIIFSVLSFFIFLPYWNVVFLALVMAVVFEPLFLKINRIISLKGLASLLTVLIVFFIITIPFLVLGTLVFKETLNLYYSLTNEKSLGFINQWFISFQKKLSILPYWSQEINLEGYLTKTLEWLIKNLGAIFSGVIQGAISLALALFLLFYLFKDGAKFKDSFISLFTLEERYREIIFQKIKSSIRSVIGGSLIVAFIQGLVAGIGFYIFGVPNPALWGGVTALAALVPTVGTSLVIVPAVIFLLLFSSWPMALGLLLWGALAVGLIDNLLRPYLMKKGTEIHPLMVLLSVLGGVSFLGPIGLIAGPVIVSVFFSLVKIYSEITKEARGN